MDFQASLKRGIGSTSAHILRKVAIKALGRPLKASEVVSLCTGYIVIYPKNAVTTIIRRNAAKKLCGHANWKWCHWCKDWGDPKEFTKDNNTYVHIRCKKDYAHARNLKSAPVKRKRHHTMGLFDPASARAARNAKRSLASFVKFGYKEMAYEKTHQKRGFKCKFCGTLN